MCEVLLPKNLSKTNVTNNCCFNLKTKLEAYWGNRANFKHKQVKLCQVNASSQHVTRTISNAPGEISSLFSGQVKGDVSSECVLKRICVQHMSSVFFQVKFSSESVFPGPHPAAEGSSLFPPLICPSSDSQGIILSGPSFCCFCSLQPSPSRPSTQSCILGSMICCIFHSFAL